MPILSARAVITAKKGGGAVSVAPSVVRSAEIGTRDTGALGWASSGTFNASGTEANRAMFVLLELFSSDGSLSNWTINSFTIGGVSATIDAAAITNTDGGRNCTVVIGHVVAPANNAALAVAWDIAISGGDAITAAKVNGVLMRDVSQATPVGANVTRTNRLGATPTESLALTTLHALSLLLGGVVTRGGDCHPMTAIDTENVLITAQTSTSPTLGTGASVFTKAAASPGATSAGVVMTSFGTNEHRGGALIEVRAA